MRTHNTQLQLTQGKETLSADDKGIFSCLKQNKKIKSKQKLKKKVKELPGARKDSETLSRPLLY